MIIRGKQLVTLLLFIILPTCILAQSKRQQNNDKELLAKAIDYYQGRKYHEALLFFEQLNNRYVLNPRFKAYMAVCYYHDNDFKKTTETLDTLLQSLTVFAPREQAVYYFINAESHFQEQNYKQALTNFEQGLPLSDNKEKGYIYKSKVKRTRRQIQDWLSQAEKDEWVLEELGLLEGKLDE